MNLLRKLISAGVLALVTSLSGTNAVAANADLTASATVLEPISITGITNIDFGIVTIPATASSCATYSLIGGGGDDSAVTTSTSIDGSECPHLDATLKLANDAAFSGTQQVGFFTVTHDSAVTTGVNISTGAPSCSNLGAAFLTINSPTSPLVLTGGTGLVFLNADLEVPAGTASTGDIGCNFTVNVNY